MKTPARKRKLERSVKRLTDMLRADAPDELVARECLLLFRHSLIVYEDLIALRMGLWMIEMVRADAGQCPSCGSKLDSRIAGAPHCGKCMCESDVEFLKEDLQHGPDPVSFDNPPS